VEFDEETRSLLTELSEKLYNTDIDESRQERGQVLEKIEGHGFRRIKLTYQRAVFELPKDRSPSEGIERTVVKSPLLDKGLRQNKEEIEVWETAPPEVKSYLLPIVDYDEDNYWLAMPYVETVETIKERVFEFEEVLDSGSLMELRKKDNWGWWRGKKRLLDYGSYVKVYLEEEELK